MIPKFTCSVWSSYFNSLLALLALLALSAHPAISICPAPPAPPAPPLFLSLLFCIPLLFCLPLLLVFFLPLLFSLPFSFFPTASPVFPAPLLPPAPLSHPAPPAPPAPPVSCSSGWLAWERFRCNTDCHDDPENCISGNYKTLYLQLHPIKNKYCVKTNVIVLHWADNE